MREPDYDFTTSSTGPRTYLGTLSTKMLMCFKLFDKLSELLPGQ